tara:strand:+ start:162 stop:554 length:393 start_codon:yes stop_codon:yes gene_type:complete
MIEQGITSLIAVLLGIMLFFSFIVAPSTFRFLNEEYARKFIRGIFPLYYLVNLVISVIALIMLVYLGNFNFEFYFILSVCVLFFISNFLLMPLINKFKDNGKEKYFKISHFVSVLINFVQIIFLTIVLFK